MKIIVKIVLFALCMFLSQKVYAYKVDTHQVITLVGTEKSEGFKNFIMEFGVDPGFAMGYAMFGSIAEDHADFFLRRYTYHFYDPENEKGLGTLDPAIKWGFAHNIPFNEFSWTEARKAQHEFFVGENHETREEAKNLFFRSLGHIVHLIQDMTQPSHTRDDPHASHFESLGGAIIFNPSQLEEWALFNGSEVLNYANSPAGGKPIQSFEHPFRTLASFSNRNFFSDDTIFKDYPQPAEDDTNFSEDFIPWGSGEVALVEAEDGQVDEVPYIVKIRGAFAGVKLAQVGYFGAQIHNLPVNKLAFQIDDEVARENAEVLIPLAVEYSAGLLDYFFRGDIDAEADGADGLKITNNSPEAMIGTFALYYDNKNEERYPVEGAEWFFSLGPGGTSDRKTFVPPEDSKEPGKYVLVFKGKMGQEGSVDGAEGFAVTGKNIQLIDVNYLFIIPQTVELLGSPSLQYSDSGMVDCPYYVEGVGWKTTSIWKHARNTYKWNLGAQRIEGKFVQFGSAHITQIRLAAFVGSTYKVFLDGEEVDPLTWRGEAGQSPTTWAIESGGSFYASPSFVVEMSDGQVFGTPMIFYRTVTESYSRSEDCDSDGKHYYLGTGSGLLSIDARAVGYQVKSMSGATFEKNRGGTYCVPNLDYEREQYSYCFIVTTATFPDLLWVLSTDFLTYEPGLSYFPRLEKNVTVDFITPPYVAERIEALGIKPIDFIVEMK